MNAAPTLSEFAADISAHFTRTAAAIEAAEAARLKAFDTDLEAAKRRHQVERDKAVRKMEQAGELMREALATMDGAHNRLISDIEALRTGFAEAIAEKSPGAAIEHPQVSNVAQLQRPRT